MTKPSRYRRFLSGRLGVLPDHSFCAQTEHIMVAAHGRAKPLASSAKEHKEVEKRQGPTVSFKDMTTMPQGPGLHLLKVLPPLNSRTLGTKTHEPLGDTKHTNYSNLSHTTHFMAIQHFHQRPKAMGLPDLGPKAPKLWVK